MSATNLIPALDPAPLPGPPWLFHVLWVVTFLIHLLFVNMVLGGSLLAALAGGASPARREIQRFFVEANSWAISLAITFGVAPLLFVQVLLGRFFYSATILVAWAWLGLLGILMVAYYLNYVAKFRLRAGRNASAVLGIVAVCFLVIALIQVVVSLLHMQPARWPAVADRFMAVFADPSLVARYLHFVLAATSMAAAALTWVAVRRAGKGGDRDVLAGMARFGVKVALLTTVLQLIDGFALLLLLPKDVLLSFMRGGVATTLPLTVGLGAGIALLVVLAQISDPLAQPTKVRRVAELMMAAILFMIVTRHQVRDLYLAPSRATEQVAVVPQWDTFAMFLVSFLVCGVGLTVWALVRAATDKPQPGERAA